MKHRPIEKQNFKLIESELYYYKDTKRELETMISDTIDSSGSQEVTSRGGVGKPTESKACQLMTSKEIIEVKRRIDAIEYMINTLKLCNEPSKLRFIEMKYFEKRYTDLGILEQLSISQKTFYRWRHEAVSLVAAKLGYKV